MEYFMTFPSLEGKHNSFVLCKARTDSLCLLQSPVQSASARQQQLPAAFVIDLNFEAFDLVEKSAPEWTQVRYLSTRSSCSGFRLSSGL